MHPNITLLPLFMFRGVLYEEGTDKQIKTPDELFASTAARLVVKSDNPFQQCVKPLLPGEKVKPRTCSTLSINTKNHNRAIGLSAKGGIHVYRHDAGDQMTIMLGYERAQTILVHETKRNTIENHYSRNTQHLDMVAMRLLELPEDDERMKRLKESRYEAMQLSGNAAKLVI